MASPFVTTSWSLIAHTREPGEAARQATAALCEQYWQPLYTFARRSGQAEYEAEDTIQGFFIHVVEDDVFTRANADRGRFRTFLLAALRQFMARQHRDAARQKRSPSSPTRSLDIESAEQALSAATNDTPERAYERAWAMTQLEQTWKQLECEYEVNGKAALVSRLRPVLSGQSDLSIREIAAGLGMSEGALNVAAHRLRRRFGEVLREQVSQTLASPDDVDDEIARLRAALAGSA